MKNHMARLVILIAINACLCSLQFCYAIAGEIWQISIPTHCLEENDRLVAFSLLIVSGRVVTIPHAPIGWNIIIDNDPSWRSTIKGTIIVGAAALDKKQDKAFFDDFVTVEEEPDSQTSLDLRLEIVTTKDFMNQKTSLFKTEDLQRRSRNE